jgi:hypothetical protein
MSSVLANRFSPQKSIVMMFFLKFKKLSAEDQKGTRVARPGWKLAG